MSLPPSTANWHWKNKNVTRWAREWFERELTVITVNGDAEGESVSISGVTEVDGDVELGQRKSKLITIYDCKIELSWTGTASDGTAVAGKLLIPEVSHEITLDGLSDYQYSWTLTTDASPAVNALFAVAKARLPTALETKFAEFPTALIDTHGRDLTVSADPSRTGTPTPAANTSTTTAAPPKPAAPVVKKAEKALNTTKVVVEATFMAAAADLFSILTDEKRIPSWTRAPAQSKVEPGGSFSLFGGGVKGTYVSLEPPTKIVQTWALQSPTWPSDHIATLTTTLDQSSDSTKVVFSLDGVPTGLDTEITRNLEGYYVQGLKSIGYVQLIISSPPPRLSSKKRTHRAPKNKPASGGQHYGAAIVIASIALLAAFTIPYLSSTSSPPPPSSSS
ncbi:hypothetical protein PLICRDRAFT_41255 [Plicaturopsis crispa FD-325 SS-3]|nr:hypothetical protein PLICRDRAFT_41255 [Plicaturopsis crispa FD-325 SS-3]